MNRFTFSRENSRQGCVEHILIAITKSTPDTEPLMEHLINKITSMQSFIKEMNIPHLLTLKFLYDFATNMNRKATRRRQKGERAMTETTQQHSETNYFLGASLVLIFSTSLVPI